MLNGVDSFNFRYELQQKGLLKTEDVGIVPDVYCHNQQLGQDVEHLYSEVERFKDAAL